MKILKIENEKALFLNKKDEYESVTKMDRDDLFRILDIIYEKIEYDIDEYNDNVSIVNPAEKIIYEQIVSQLTQFVANVESLTSEINEIYEPLPSNLQNSIMNNIKTSD